MIMYEIKAGDDSIKTIPQNKLLDVYLADPITLQSHNGTLHDLDHAISLLFDQKAIYAQAFRGTESDTYRQILSLLQSFTRYRLK